MSLMLLPGSFDPMTLGHFRMVQYALTQCDRVVVALLVNPEKTYCFSKEERLKIAKETVKSLPNVSVISDDGLLVDLYRRLGADAVLKGVRNEKDLAYEEKMAEWNRAHCPTFRTVYYTAEGTDALISSTALRQNLAEGKSIVGLAHPDALQLTEALYREKIAKNNLPGETQGEKL